MTECRICMECEPVELAVVETEGAAVIVPVVSVIVDIVMVVDVMLVSVNCRQRGERSTRDCRRSDRPGVHDGWSVW